MFVVSYKGVSIPVGIEPHAKEIVAVYYNFANKTITSKGETASEINLASDSVLEELQAILENIGLIVTEAELAPKSGTKPREITKIKTVEKTDQDAVNALKAKLDKVTGKIYIKNGTNSLATDISSKLATNIDQIKVHLHSDANIDPEYDIVISEFPKDLTGVTVKVSITTDGKMTFELSKNRVTATSQEIQLTLIPKSIPTTN